MRVTLRPVEESDREFLLRVYAGTRAQELALVPWTPAQKDSFVSQQFAAQTEQYAASHPQASHRIICRDGEPAGRLYVDRRAEEIHILDITVVPESRNTGVGSSVIGEILREADQAGKAVTIYVESFNPSLAWFKRRGFRELSVSGFHALLEWKASAS